MDFVFALSLNDFISRIEDSSAKIRLAEPETIEEENNFEQAEDESEPICFIAVLAVGIVVVHESVIPLHNGKKSRIGRLFEIVVIIST